MLRRSLPYGISNSSRHRIARWLVGSPIEDVERDLILETLATTHGNRTISAHMLGVSVRTLRNKINEYSASGFDVAKPHSGDSSRFFDGRFDGET